MGRWKDTLKRSLRALCEWAPWSAAFFAALALLSFGDAFFGAEGFVALGVLVVAISLKSMSANDICTQRPHPARPAAVLAALQHDVLDSGGGALERCDGEDTHVGGGS